MRFNKISRKLTAAILTGAMTVSMLGMTAFAAPVPDGGNSTFTLTKEITKPGNVYIPSATFKFTISAGTEQTGLKDSAGAPLSSPANGLSFEEVADGKDAVVETSFTSGPSDSDISNAEENTVTVGEIQLHVNAAAFANLEAGVYRYKIKESPSNCEGMDDDIDIRYVDVYHDKDDNNTILFVTTDKDGKEVKDDGVITNKYGIGTEPSDKLYKLVVSKTVYGNQGELKKAFNFEIQVTDSDHKANQYYVEYGDGNTTKITSDENGKITIPLMNGQTATVYGLSINDSYAVAETTQGEGYTTYVYTDTKVDDRASLDVAHKGNTATGTPNGADKEVNVYNDKNVSTPTGVAMTVAPYILMVALAGVFAFMFLRRRNRAEY